MQPFPQPKSHDLYYILRTFTHNGFLTPPIRALLTAKRKRLLLTKQQLAQMLRLSLQTIIAWEKGHTRRCSIKHRQLIVAFLTGYLPSLAKPGNRKTS